MYIYIYIYTYTHTYIRVQYEYSVFVVHYIIWYYIILNYYIAPHQAPGDEEVRDLLGLPPAGRALAPAAGR